MTGVAKNAPWKWMQVNDLPSNIPDDAYLHVDERDQRITVELFARDDEGRQMFHGGHLMTTVAQFPLKVSPPPGLLDAYQHTVHRLRVQRDAATAIRTETAQTLIERLGLDPFRVFEALNLPVPIEQLKELP